MSRYVIDSWAWIEYLVGSEPGRKAKDIIENEDILTSIVTVAEITSKMARAGKDVGSVFSSIASLSKIIVGNPEFAKGVGILHSQVKKKIPNFSLGDAFVLHTAKTLNAKVLTGDSDFKTIKGAVMLK